METLANAGCAVRRVPGFDDATGGKKHAGNFWLMLTFGLSIHFGTG